MPRVGHASPAPRPVEIQTHIDIDASPERVWEVLTDFPTHPSWNPFIREISGEVREGAELRVVLGPRGKPVTFRPTVVEAEAPRALVWLGTFGGAWLFRGEHRFRLEALPDGGTRFHHGEAFGGLLLPLLRTSLDTETRAGFEAMNAALKARAEGGA